MKIMKLLGVVGVSLVLCASSLSAASIGELEAAAAGGDRDAIYKAGSAYYFGSGVKRDVAKAFEWFTKGAEAGHTYSMNRLGEIHHYGYLGEKDPAQALKWFSKASRNHPRSMYFLAHYYRLGLGGLEVDYAKAVEQLQRSLKANRTGEAVYELGQMYASGQGYPYDFAQALKLYEEAAGLGYREALETVGRCYEFGLGTMADSLKAIEWYTKAAEDKSETAMIDLGSLYHSGHGVGPDPAKARAWYDKAIQRYGSFTAKKLLYKLENPDEVAGLVGSQKPNYERGKALFDEGRYQEAAEVMTESIDAFGYFAKTRYYRGKAWRQLGKLDDALEEFEAAVAREPNLAGAYREMAHIYSEKGDQAKTLEYLNLAIRWDHSEGEYFQGRGIWFFEIPLDYQRAEIDFTQAVDRDPKAATSWARLGQIHDQWNWDAQALEGYSRAIELDYPDVNLRVQRANLFQQFGENEQAISDLNRALEEEPENHRWWNQRGYVFQTHGFLHKALRDTLKAYELSPDFAYYNRRLGYLHDQLGDYESAIRSYSEAIRLERNLEESSSRRSRLANDLLDRAWVYWRQGQYEAALRDQEESIQLFPTKPLGYLRRGQLNRNLGNFPTAIYDFNRAFTLGWWENSDPLLARAYCYRQMDLNVLAERDYLLAVQSWPDNPVMLLTRGGFRFAQGNQEQALDDLKAAIALDHQHRLLQVHQHYVPLQFGSEPYARELLDEVITAESKDADAWFGRGIVRGRAKDPEGALSDLSRAIELDPDHGPAFFARGDLQVYSGRLGEGIADLTNALALTSTNAAALSDRSFAYLLQGKSEEAVADMDRLLELVPNSALTLVMRGMAWRQLGNEEAARTNLLAGIQRYRAVDTSLQGTFARFYESGMESAANLAMDTALALRQLKDSPAPYPSLYKYAILLKSGGYDAAREFLRGRGDDFVAGVWPAPVYKFLSGERSAAEVVEAAADPDELTEAHAFVGLTLLAQGKKNEAREHLRWVVEQGNQGFTEYQLARAEWARMNMGAE